MSLLMITLGLLPGLAVPALPRDVFEVSAPGAVKIAGPLGQRMQTCIDKELLSTSVDRLVKPFRDKTDDLDEGWRCEYWGKWATGLALAGDQPAARARLIEATNALIATADADGYIGTRSPGKRLQGWDVWGRKYVLLGLIATYDITKDPAILAAAKRHLLVLAKEVAPGKVNLTELGYADWQGLPPSSILEPTCQLYQRTHDPKVLEFASQIVSLWDVPNKLTKTGLRLVELANDGTPPSEIGSAKAYEQMSCFEGMCEMYRCTGDRKFLTAATKLGDGILRDEINVIGTGSNDERWQKARTHQTSPRSKPSETCVTATWMKLCVQLLRLTGDAKYADALETSLDNALLAAYMPDGRWWAYFTSTMGERVPSYKQHDDVGLSCCVVNGPRGLLLTPKWAVMTAKEGPVVNLFNPGTAATKTPSGQPLALSFETRYPYDGAVAISLNLEKPETFTLRVRIPGWSEQTQLLVNGKPESCQPGGYALIHRNWKKGDLVRVNLDFRGRLIQAPDGNGQVAVARGPLVLALSALQQRKREGTEIETIESDSTGHVQLHERTDIHGVGYACDVTTICGSERRSLLFTDFASAGNSWKSSDQFRVWLPQPFAYSKLFPTGQTWQMLTHSSFRPDEP